MPTFEELTGLACELIEGPGFPVALMIVWCGIVVAIIAAIGGMPIPQ